MAACDSILPALSILSTAGLTLHSVAILLATGIRLVLLLGPCSHVSMADNVADNIANDVTAVVLGMTVMVG